jgi:hypothetical protein
LIGPEVRTTGAVCIESLEFPYSVLDIAALAIDLFIEPPRP